MSELPPGVPDAPEPADHHDDEPAHFPRWVPGLIGAVLVALAALAVYTGVRYRSSGLVNIVKSRRAPQTTAPSPPGEPEAGASLMFPGESGDNTPTAGPAATGPSRAVITGTGGSVSGVVRAWARRGMSMHVTPDDAVIYVNDVPVGEARQFAGSDQVYDFPAAGSFTVKIVAPGYKARTFLITAAEDAKNEIARLDVKLDKE